MSKEVPLQVDLFTGELVDTRTRKQKKQATHTWSHECGSPSPIVQTAAV
jgi:hypothetical protein